MSDWLLDGVILSTDKQGHEHAPKGSKKGGQFVKKGKATEKKPKWTVEGSRESTISLAKHLREHIPRDMVAEVNDATGEIVADDESRIAIKRAVVKQVAKRMKANADDLKAFCADHGVDVTITKEEALAHSKHAIEATKDIINAMKDEGEDTELLSARNHNAADEIRTLDYDQATESHNAMARDFANSATDPDTNERFRSIFKEAAEAHKLAATALRSLTHDSPEEHAVNILIKEWAKTSAKSSLAALVQMRAKEAFDIDDAYIRKDAPTFVIKDHEKKVVDAYIWAIYENTQEELKKRGIEHMHVVRGMVSHEAVDSGVQEVQLQPLSSFATAIPTAIEFAKYEDASVVVGETIPRKDIFSTCATGPGCANESEIIVLGGIRKMGVKRVDTSSSDTDRMLHVKVTEGLHTMWERHNA